MGGAGDSDCQGTGPVQKDTSSVDLSSSQLISAGVGIDDDDRLTRTTLAVQIQTGRIQLLRESADWQHTQDSSVEA